MHVKEICGPFEQKVVHHWKGILPKDDISMSIFSMSFWGIKRQYQILR
jgi:hypothetical protein